MKRRVTGIGGVFLKADDPESTRSWYQKHLGIQSGRWGGTFQWKKPAMNQKMDIQPGVSLSLILPTLIQVQKMR